MRTYRCKCQSEELKDTLASWDLMRQSTEGHTLAFPHTLCDAHTLPEVGGVRFQGQGASISP